MSATENQMNIFNSIAPELAADTDNSQIDAFFDIYSDMLSAEYFGKFYDRALAFFVAHQLTLSNIADDDGADDAYLTAGAIRGERLGDAMKQYDQLSANSDDNALLSKTYYGRMYLQIRDMLRIPCMTRM